MFYSLIKKFYYNTVYARNDADGTLHYFSAADFEGLKAVPYSFTSSLGHTLNGFFYSYPDPIAGRLVIFEHGMGGGHTAYMKEIEMLCQKGLMVLAYDHSGCMSSEGETTGGFARSLRDLNDCLDSLKRLRGFQNLDISVMGHSWGGFSAMNIGALHPEVRRIVALSGFTSLKDIIEQNFRGLLQGAGRRLLEEARAQDPEYARFEAFESLKKTEAKVLIIHSEDDKMVSVDGFERLRSALDHHPNLTFLRVRHKRHNPNYTDSAVKYKSEFFSIYPKEKKRLKTDEQKASFVASFDWHRMTEQDPLVWEQIYKALEV